jgi:hypothetical protein
MNNNDFRDFATKHLRMNGLALDKYVDIYKQLHFSFHS